MNWTSEWPEGEPAVYWIRLIEMKHHCVIGYISKEHIHYTNGEREHKRSARVNAYEFLGPITPQLVERAMELEAIEQDALDEYYYPR